MIYLASFHAVGVEPCTYKQLSNVCYNLSNGSSDYIVYGERTIFVDWIEQFKSFAWDSIKWYDLKNIGLYHKIKKWKGFSTCLLGMGTGEEC